MSLSLLFSIAIYQVTTNEVHTRIEDFKTSVQSEPAPIKLIDNIVGSEAIAQSNLSTRLLYINILILVVGGFVSYFLARFSLLPIEKSHEAQSRFTSDASHELRTPLAIMKTELEVAIRDENATIRELKQTLSSNLEEVDKLSKLAEMLLGLSQLDNDKLKIKPINLDKITRRTINNFNKSSDRISINSKKRLIINGNEVAIEDLIKILIDNSIQYSPKKSKVLINITRQGNCAKFEITNSGPGINKNKLPHIFDRFYRADSSRTKGKNKGYGLGLALAKNIVELHNGELTATSEPNKKTTFVLLLPLK